MAKQKIVATKELLTHLKRAVQALEDSWDAEKDFEIEAGRDFDNLGELVEHMAAAGADNVTLDDVQQFLDEDYEDNQGE